MVSRHAVIAVIAVAGIAVHLVARFWMNWSATTADIPLLVVLAVGGIPLVVELSIRLIRRQFGSDLLAGISIVSAVLLHEYLAGAFVTLMLSGGEALEALAAGRASSALAALARRMPSTAHRRREQGIDDVELDAVQPGDELVVFPHEICPVDGVVIDGHSVMDESYLTGEPFMMSKAPGNDVVSGAINGDAVLTVRATRRAVDSRYARIVAVMRDSEQRRSPMRRLADSLGAWYTPLALSLALLAWALTGEPIRFLAVLVVATPCPLLIGIPVAIVGSISLAARRGIIIRDPAILEQIDRCRTIVLDKTGTLTYGRPTLTDEEVAAAFEADGVLQLAASLERYSKHPLAAAVRDAAETRGLPLLSVSDVSERPGAGLVGTIDGATVEIMGRRQLTDRLPDAVLPPVTSGLECQIVVNGRYAATYRFHDAPREDSRVFVDHLRPVHGVTRVLLVTGDRDEEAQYLARAVGIREVLAGKTPEEKVEITRAETSRAPTLFLGDGINDAPALLTATVGVALGPRAEITTEAAGAVIMDASLRRVDELLHIGRRMRRIALESAVGGMALSVVGMLLASAGFLPPVAGAVFQELIDLAAVLNALRAAAPGKSISDF